MHRKEIFLCGLILFSQAIILLVLPLPLRYALDQFSKHIAADDAISILLKTTAVVLLLGAISSCLEYLEELYNVRLINKFVTNTRAILIEKTLTREQNFINSWKKVEILGRIVGDVQNLEAIIVSGNVVLLRSLPSLILVVGAMFYIKVTFAAFIFLMLPIFYLIVNYLTKKIKVWEKDLRQNQVKYEQNLLQTLNSLALVKSLNGEDIANKNINGEQKILNYATEQTKKYVGLFNSSFSFSRHFMRAMVVFFGGVSVLKGYITLGTLFAFVTYLESLNRPIAEISNFLSRLGKATTSLERMEEYYSKMEEHGEISGDVALTTDWKKMRFNNVTLKYESHIIFENLNLNFERKEVIAIVGASGSGKSSFIRLLNRLQRVSAGNIFIDDTILNDFKLKSLRENICSVSQDPFFISASVRDNLTMALSYTPNDNQIYSALKAVNAYEFVLELPQALDTLIGETGVQISGGQSKRLSLARAFLRSNSAQVFIFDEPTSGLDPISATNVMESITSLVNQNKLILYSTHRLEEFALADRVLFFTPDSNPILATHEILIKENTAYQQMIADCKIETTDLVVNDENH